MGCGNTLEEIAIPVVSVVASAFLGPEVGLGLGLAEGAGADTIGGGLVGAALGAGGSAIEGRNPLTGALEGGVGGAIGPNLSDIGSGVGNALGISGDSGTAATDATSGIATTGAAGSPTITPAAASASASPSGSFVAPSSTDALGAQDINQALSPSSLSGQSLSEPTQMGDITSQALVNPPSATDGLSLGGGDSANLGPVNASPSITPSAGPASFTPPPAAAGATDSSFLSGGAQPNLSDTSSVLSTSNAAPAAVAGATPSAPSGVGNLLSKGEDFLTNSKNLPSLLGAGFTAVEALQGPEPLAPAAKSLQNQGNALNATGQQDLANAEAGIVTAPQQAEISEYVQNAQNQLYQQLASAGVTNPQGDSRYIQGMQQIQQQAQAMAAAYIQQTFTNAMGEAGQAANDLNAAAADQTSSDNTFTTALSNATASIGGMAALSNLTKKAA